MALPACNFVKVAECTRGDGSSVSAYKSEKTGLRVGLVQVKKRVLAKSIVVVPTPYCLHDAYHRVMDTLMSYGSESYPWKDFMEQVGKRRLLQYRTSWTSLDEHVFLMESACGQPCCNLLPAFLENIFFPLMLNSAFISEIYHVDGNGKDGGTLYEEFELRERDGASGWSEFIDKATMRLLLGEKARSSSKDAPYEIEGFTHLLRDSNLIKETKAFHKQFYRPENAIVIVCGNVEPDDLLATLHDFDMKLLGEKAWIAVTQEHEKGGDLSATGRRPMSGKFRNYRVSPADLTEEASEKQGSSGSFWDCFKCGHEGSTEALNKLNERLSTTFPDVGFAGNLEEDFVAATADYNQSVSMAQITWQGPMVGVDDWDEFFSLNILMKYLADATDSPVTAVVEKVLADWREKAGDEADGICMYVRAANVMTPSRLFLRLHLHGVPKDYLDSFSEKITSTVVSLSLEIWSQESMRNYLERTVVSWTDSLESGNFYDLAVCFANYFLYWPEEDFSAQMNVESHHYKLLLEKDANYWMGLLHKYLGADKPRVLVRSHPSVEVRMRLEAEAEERANKRRQIMDRAALDALQKKLEAAKAQLMWKLPGEALNAIPVPDIGRLDMETIDYYANFAIFMDAGVSEIRPNLPFGDLTSLPIRTMVTGLQTKTIAIHLIADTSSMPLELRAYVPLFLGAILNAPLMYPPGVRWEGLRTQSEVSGEDPGEKPEEISLNRKGYQFVPSSIVKAELNEVTSYTYYARQGIAVGAQWFNCGEMAAYACLGMTVEARKYIQSVKILRDLIFYTNVQDPACILATLKEADSQLFYWNSGTSYLARTMNMDDMNQKNDSNRRLGNVLRQEAFIKEAVSVMEQKLGQKSEEIEGTPEESAEKPSETPELKINPEDIVKAIRDVQRFFQDNLCDFVMNIDGNLKAACETSGQRLEEPLRDVLLAAYEQHCERHTLEKKQPDFANPYQVTHDWTKWSPFANGQTDGDAGGAADNAFSGCIVRSNSEEEGDDAVMILTAQVDFNPWVDVAKRLSLQMLLNHVYGHGDQWKVCEPEDFGEDDYLYASPEFYPSDRVMSLTMSTKLARNLPYCLSNLLANMESIFFEPPTDDDALSLASTWSDSATEYFRQLDSSNASSVLLPFHGVTAADHARRCLEFAMHISWQDVWATARPYVQALLSPVTARCGVLLKKNPDTTSQELADAFKEKCGWSLQPYESMADYLHGTSL